MLLSQRACHRTILGTCTMSCTHMLSCRGPTDEISFCHLACCATTCIPPTKATAATPVCPCLAFPSRPHPQLSPHTPCEMGRAWLPHYKWRKKSISFPSIQLLCLSHYLSPSHTNTLVGAKTITHVDRKMPCLWSISFLFHLIVFLNFMLWK